MISDREGYQLVKSGDRLHFMRSSYEAPEIPAPKIGTVQLVGSRSNMFDGSELGIMFTKKGELYVDYARSLDEKGFFDTNISFWATRGDERYRLSSRATHTESGLSLASLTEENNWSSYVDTLGRSLGVTDKWEKIIEGPKGLYIWFTEPNIEELSKLRFQFS